MNSEIINDLVLKISPLIPKQAIGVLAVLIFLFFTALIVKLLRVFVFSKLKKLAEKSTTEFDDKILEILHKPLEYFIYLIAIYISVKTVGFDSSIQSKIFLIIKFSAAINSGYLAFRFVDLIELSLLKLSKRDDNALDDQFVLSSKKIIRIAVLLLVLIIVLENFGINVSGIITGLGIGGLAIALAAQDTLGNLFGSLTILFDKPFKVGDYIIISDNSGTVERIGLRSTKLRTRNNFLVTVPNHVITNSITQNITERKIIRVDQTIGLIYGTKPDIIQNVIKGIKDIVNSDKNTTEDVYAFFSTFNNYSLDLAITYYIDPPDYWISKEVQDRINFKIMELCKTVGAEMAFPTQTLELKKLN